MAKDEEYEMLPQQVLSDLKNDVDVLKKKMAQPDSKINELILEIESLKDSIGELNTVFQKALEETKAEGDVGQNFKNIAEKLETVVMQNETIAKGMIAISDKLEDFMSKPTAPPAAVNLSSRMPPVSQPQFTMGMPSPPGAPARFAPRSSMEDNEDNLGMSSNAGMMGNLDFPPPPPGMTSNGRKKSMAGMFK